MKGTIMNADLQAAQHAVSVARDALAEREGAVRTLDDEIARTRLELATLDALTSVTQAQLVGIENLRRTLRRLDEERSTAAAAVATARTAVASAQKEEDRAKLPILDAEVAAAVASLDDKVLAFATSTREEVAAIQQKVREGRALEARCGERPRIRGGFWDDTQVSVVSGLVPFLRSVVDRAVWIDERRRNAANQAESDARRAAAERMPA
jgi:predicted  nucleic acid-binding Zn-ribbon protein